MLGLGLAALVILLHLFTHWYQQAVEKSVAPALPQAVGSSDGLVAYVWADEGEVSADGRLRLWIMFENRTGGPVRDLRFLVFRTPGFKKTGECWVNGFPACRPAGVASPPGLPEALENKEAVTVFADLAPKTWYGRHGASGIFTWQDPQGARGERALVLPAVRISSWRAAFLSSLGRLVELLKDLALPVVLLYLGWYLKQYEKRREEKREEREKEEQRVREEREREQARLLEEKEREQTRLRETWNLMLPKSHANAERHYMPVAASIAGIDWALESLPPEGGSEEEQRLLFELLRFLRRMKFLATEIGGFYFRDREGEALAGECWDLFYRRARRTLRDEDYDRTVGSLATEENFAKYLEKFSLDVEEGPDPAAARERKKVSEALGRVASRMEQWRKDGSFERDLALARMLRVILYYEMNRPYDPWYGTPTSFPREEFEKAWEGMDPGFKDLRERLKVYAERLSPASAA